MHYIIQRLPTCQRGVRAEDRDRDGIREGVGEEPCPVAGLAVGFIERVGHLLLGLCDGVCGAGSSSSSGSGRGRLVQV